MTIFQIEAAMYELIDMETGEITDIEKLESLEQDLEQKKKNYIRFYKNLDAECKALRDMEKEFADRRHKKEKTMESLLRLLDYHQQGSKWECTEGVIKYTKSTSTEEVDEQAFLEWDGKWSFGDTEFKADKKAIKDAIKEGIEIPGWTLTEKQNISIK